MESEVEKHPEKRKRAELNITFYNQRSVFGISIRTGHLTSMLCHRKRVGIIEVLWLAAWLSRPESKYHVMYMSTYGEVIRRTCKHYSLIREYWRRISSQSNLC